MTLLPRIDIIADDADEGLSSRFALNLIKIPFDSKRINKANDNLIMKMESL